MFTLKKQICPVRRAGRVKKGKEMQKMRVLLNTVEKIKDFNEKLQSIEANCDLSSETYTIDAKSIMGIFALDVSRPLYLTVHSDTADLESLRQYEV